MAASAVTPWSWGRAPLTSETEQPRRAEFRNRPGRDLLIALAICYLPLAVLGLMQSADPMALVNALIAFVVVPLSLLLIIAQTNLYSAAVGGLFVLLVVAFVVRLQWFIRIPLLVAIFVGAYYTVALAGVTLG